MIDQPTTRLPTAAERRLWQFDLAKRIVRLGRDNQHQLILQMRSSVERLRLDLFDDATHQSESAGDNSPGDSSLGDHGPGDEGNDTG